VISGKRVRLRAVERSDLPKFHGWLNDSEVTQGLAMFLPLSMGDEEKWFDRVMQGEPEQRALAIDVKDGQAWKLIGNAGLFNLEWNNRSAEFGIFIGDKSCWDKGHGTEALELILRHGFHTLNLHRIFLRVYASNARARRSYEKAGFVLEGTMREAVFRDGKYGDVHIMSVLRSEWETHREEA
jgi:RimJ/RimL family protein N-acetyltransferase